MLQWISTNKDWLFSGVGVLFLTLLFGLITKRKKDTTGSSGAIEQQIAPQQTVNVYSNGLMTKAIEGEIGGGEKMGDGRTRRSEADLKISARILFIDDDRTFKIVSVLKKSGWKNVEIVGDVQRLDAESVKLADIIFVDIQGVGRKLGFGDEGLGLARGIRETYPEKKIVIYSAVSGHDPFAKGFRVADDRLSKNAEPYEFQKAIIDLLS